MTNKKSTTLQMERVADLIFRDLLETSDEEILKEAVEDGMDIEKEVERINSIISEASFSSGQARLAAAKKAFLERKLARPEHNPFQSFSLSVKRKIIGELKTNDNLKKKITLAARNENELSENDINACLQSLYERKVIDEEGKILCD